MEFETFRHGDILRINILSKRIDAAASIRFKDRMRELCGEEPGIVLLDLSHVEFLDSSGLGAVVATMKMLGQERSLQLAGLTEKVAKVFRLTRMDTIFTIHADADLAIGAAPDAA